MGNNTILILLKSSQTALKRSKIHQFTDIDHFLFLKIIVTCVKHPPCTKTQKRTSDRPLFLHPCTSIISHESECVWHPLGT